MHLRCEMQGFYVAVRGNIEHHNQAKVFSTDKASRFLTQILGVDPRRLALKLESYVISDLSGVGSIRGTKADEVSECRKLIQGGLRELYFILFGSYLAYQPCQMISLTSTE